ncbi:PD40 domain-containing protein [Bacteroides sp. 519]|uniref:TolB family protein n=1 Tax=Bacteroides sp. 519 TaxID=2302937 RepID=UPI0013D1F14A|nr:PD40 domain-containing protein [Bacteroides sp. 519]NDV60173.1 hypothetical protein [Bacteroides sp. 519]
MKYAIYLSLLLLVACHNVSIPSYVETNKYAIIYPGYEGTYIPYNIAPLNFRVDEEANTFLLRLVAGKDSFEVQTKQNFDIPLKKWKKLLATNKGQKLYLKLFALKENSWYKYKDIEFTISADAIDPYLAYRLIEPGYEVWGEMGIYQRCLETFCETPILENSLTDGSCMNCHSFRNNDPTTMTFHIRGQHAGTIFVKNDDAYKVNTKSKSAISAGVYPRWHKDGRYVAFSNNATSQSFWIDHPNKVEVFDVESDISIYDTRTNRMIANSLLNSKGSFETFPEWSPTGDYLYFCSARFTNMPANYENIKYDLLRGAFNTETATVSAIDTLVSSAVTNKSVSMPRVSPDGRYVLFCMADYGTFPIWHKENDLYTLDLQTGDITNLTEVNSEDSDSYHSWSSNGRWIVFASRRMDGRYTRPYIAYFDEKGRAHKPFVVPQSNPGHYDLLLKSYNIPEFMIDKVRISPHELEKVVKGEAKRLVE